MSNGIRNAVFFFVVALASSALADGWVFLSRQEGTWRVSGGAVMDFGVRTRLRTNQRETYVSPFVSGGTAAQAEMSANGIVHGTRRIYPNGAWIDMNDPGIAGDMPGYTSHYSFPGAPGENNLGRVFSLGSAAYSEVSAYGTHAGSVSHYESDDSVVPGFGLEVARTLYCNDKYHFGVDLAFAFQYFFRRSVYRDSSSWSAGSTARSGAYSASVDTGDVYAGDDPNEDWNWRTGADGSSFYGSGEPSADGTYGYAGPINGGAVSISSTSSVRRDSAFGSMDSKADYENIEFMLLARPYYDVTSWLRVIGTIGLAVSRQELDFVSTMMRDGRSQDYSRTFDGWNVYGVAGLGAAAHYKGLMLGVDAFARFLDGDLDVDDRYVEGSVSRGTWVGRLTIGYSF